MRHRSIIVGYLAPCHGCRAMRPERSMRVLYGNQRCCDDCWPVFSFAYGRACVRCGGEYITDPSIEASICPECLWRDPAIQSRRVDIQLSRARRFGRPATLTLCGWLETLEYFAGKCAYCLQADYAVIEHFQPVERAGTTAQNCVPACTNCNARKHRGRAWGIQPVDLDRVYDYLQTRRNTFPKPRQERHNDVIGQQKDALRLSPLSAF